MMAPTGSKYALVVHMGSDSMDLYWLVALAEVNEIGATLQTPNLPLSTSGMERAFRIALCRQPA